MMEATVVDSINAVAPNDGEIKISTIDEKKSSPSQESSSNNHQESSTNNLKLKRCKHGRIIIKDSSKKKQPSDTKQVNQSEGKVIDQANVNKDTHRNDSSVAIEHRQSALESCQLDASTNFADEIPLGDALKDISDANIFKTTDNGDQPATNGFKNAISSPKNDRLSECEEKSTELRSYKTDDNMISPKERKSRSRSKSRSFSRSRSRSPSRRQPYSPSHRKSPRRYQRARSPRGRRFSRSPVRRYRSRSPKRRDRSRRSRSNDRTGSYGSSSKRSRHHSPRKNRNSPSDHRRNRQSSRHRSPRQRRLRSRSRSPNPNYSHRNARLNELKNDSSTNSISIESLNSDQTSSNTHDGPKNLPSNSLSSKIINELKPLNPKIAQSGNDDSKTSPPARSSMSPLSDSSISSDIYDPEGPIIPISPGDSPPLPSPTNNAASNFNNNNDAIAYHHDGDKNDDDVPSSAVQLNHQEKYLQKLNRQERVVEEVKMALKPHYGKRAIDKEQYKDVLRRAVPKICHSKNGEINPVKIRALVDAYVKKMKRR